jgi:hypothetical protein
MKGRRAVMEISEQSASGFFAGHTDNNFWAWHFSRLVVVSLSRPPAVRFRPPPLS